MMNDPEGCPECGSLKIETVLSKVDRLVKRCECGHKWNEAKEEDRTMDTAAKQNDSANNLFGPRSAFLVATAVLDAAQACYMNAFGRCAIALTDYSRGLDEDRIDAARAIMHRIETDLLALGNMMRNWSRS